MKHRTKSSSTRRKNRIAERERISKMLRNYKTGTPYRRELSVKETLKLDLVTSCWIRDGEVEKMLMLKDLDEQQIFNTNKVDDVIDQINTAVRMKQLARLGR